MLPRAAQLSTIYFVAPQRSGLSHRPRCDLENLRNKCRCPVGTVKECISLFIIIRQMCRQRTVIINYLEHSMGCWSLDVNSSILRHSNSLSSAQYSALLLLRLSLVLNQKTGCPSARESPWACSSSHGTFSSLDVLPCDIFAKRFWHWRS